MVGLLTSVLFVYITQYYTEYRFRPVRSIAEVSQTGTATNIITGASVALECTAMPGAVISAAIILSYPLGQWSGLPHGGLYGTAIATMGMLATCAYILAMDTFGGGPLKGYRRPLLACPDQAAEHHHPGLAPLFI